MLELGVEVHKLGHQCCGSDQGNQRANDRCDSPAHAGQERDGGAEANNGSKESDEGQEDDDTGVGNPGSMVIVVQEGVELGSGAVLLDWVAQGATLHYRDDDVKSARSQDQAHRSRP